MTPEQRQRLIDEFPQQVGNTDGVPWDMRVAANRVNIAQAIVDGLGDPASPAADRASTAACSVRSTTPHAAAAASTGRSSRSIPARASLIELNGNLATAKSVAVMVPGLNTTIEGSAANTQTASRFVSATRGEVAAITYLGGPFPRGNPRDRARRRRRPALRAGHGAAPGRVQRGRRPHRRRHRTPHPRHLHRPLLRRVDRGHRRSIGPDSRPDAVRGRGRGRRRRRRSRPTGTTATRTCCDSR